MPQPIETDTIRIEAITSLARFDALASEYTLSHEASCVASPFSSHAWVSARWHAEASITNGRAYVIPSAGLPTYVATFDEWGTYYKVPVLRRRLFGSDHGVTCLGGDADARSVADWVDASLRPWVLFQLGPLLSGSETLMEIGALLAKRGRHVHVGAERNPFLLLPERWEDFLSARSKNFRRSVSRKLRDFEAHGRFRVTVSHRPSADEILDVVVPVSKRSWQGKGKLSVVQSSGRDFYQRLAGPDGPFLHLCTIHEQDEPAGYLIGIVVGSTYHAYETAFDPKYADASPGFILHIAAIRDLIRQRLTELNFGFDAPYKSRFSPEYRELPTLSVFGSRVMGSAAAAARARYEPDDAFTVLER